MKESPKRMCVVCREMKDKKTLIRVVRSKDGEIKVDETGKANGRGAYVCRNCECIENCRKKKCFERVFGVEISSQIYEELREKVGNTKL